ncbi:MAG TPA: GlsB/YeaQ/YmgE family stress response membrane protein [Pyrinomonadaceae bacterium]|nr:GlsB/YeaQ/YmgE family stress response membrane protein [Pyrinomonadaceae bacterium]
MFGEIIGGLIVGVIARLIMPGKEAFPDGIVGWILTALLGIVGAVIGGFVARALWAGDSYAAGWIMSILGAIILLVIVRMIFGTKKI